MRAILTTAVLVACAGGLIAQDKKFESKDGRFSVKFPAEPKTSSHKTKDADLHITSLEKGEKIKTGFAVVYSDMSADTLKKAPAAKILEGAEKGLVDQFKGKVTKSKETTVGAQKYPARDILVEKDENHIRLLIVLADTRLYQVFVVGPKDAVTNKEAEDFFSSFEITK